MANKDKLNYTKTTRFNKKHIEFLDELEQQGKNLRDVLDYYMEISNNETQRLKNRQKYLFNHIKELKIDLEKSEKELEEVRAKLGLAPTEDQDRLDLIEAESLIVERAKSKYESKYNKSTLKTYLFSAEADRVLNPIIANYGIKDKEKFKNELAKRFEF